MRGLTGARLLAWRIQPPERAADLPMPEKLAETSPRIKELTEKLRKSPGSRVFMELAREHHAAGGFEEAARICREGLEKHPAYHTARVLLAKSLLGLGLHDEASAELLTVLGQAPDNVMARRLLAEAYTGARRYEEAQRTLEELLRLHPDDVESVERLEELKAEGPTGGHRQVAESGAVGVSTVKVAPGEEPPEPSAPEAERQASAEEAAGAAPVEAARPAFVVDPSEDITLPPPDRSAARLSASEPGGDVDAGPPTDPYLLAEPRAWTVPDVAPAKPEPAEEPAAAMETSGETAAEETGAEGGEAERATVMMSPSDLEGLESPAAPVEKGVSEAGEQSTVMMTSPVLEAPSEEAEADGDAEHATVMMTPEDLARGLESGAEPEPASEAPAEAASVDEDAARTAMLEPEEVAALAALPDTAGPGMDSASEAEAAPAPPEEIEAEAEAEDDDGMTSALATPTLAELYRSQGMPEKALEIYEQVLAGDPDNAEIRGRVQQLRESLAPPPESVDRKKIRVLRQWLGNIRRAGNAQDRA